jgi:hypothetical protein
MSPARETARKPDFIEYPPNVYQYGGIVGAPIGPSLKEIIL